MRKEVQGEQLRRKREADLKTHENAEQQKVLTDQIALEQEEMQALLDEIASKEEEVEKDQASVDKLKSEKQETCSKHGEKMERLNDEKATIKATLKRAQQELQSLHQEAMASQQALAQIFLLVTMSSLRLFWLHVIRVATAILLSANPSGNKETGGIGTEAESGLGGSKSQD